MTNSTKPILHTPGPLHLAKDEDGIFFAIAGGDESRFRSRTIARMVTSPNDPKDLIAEQNACAQLFAAAPETAAERDRLKEINVELLEALSAASCDPYFADLDAETQFAIEQSISRAKGETP